VSRLGEAEIEAALATLPGWTREGEALSRRFRRRDWADAIAFVDAIAVEAESRNHHPDLAVTGYRTVTVTLTSHDAGGITERDVSMARAIDGLATRDG
jgi:4a-hydroxytetrahydrobiopterin dehydratase